MGEKQSQNKCKKKTLKGHGRRRKIFFLMDFLRKTAHLFSKSFPDDLAAFT